MTQLYDADTVRMKPRVSAVLPTRNRASLLPDALQSVFAQRGAGTTFDLDVIVVDDASTDNTADVVARHAAARYIKLPENVGPSAARNAGLQASRGEYITFIDDDDVWLPGKLELQLAAMERVAGVGVVYSQYYLQRRGKPPALIPEAHSAPSGWVLPVMLAGDWSFSTLNLLIRRSAFERVGGFDESLDYGEDRDISFRLARHVPFVFAPGPVFIYRQAGGLSSMDNARRLSALRRVLEKALTLLPETEESARIRSIVWTRFGLESVPEASWRGDFDEAQKAIVTAVRTIPNWPEDRILRRAITAYSRAAGFRSSRPVRMLEQFCNEIVRSAEGTVPSPRLRGVLADVWREGTVGLGSSPRRRLIAVGHAAVRAGVLDPIGAVSRDLVKAVVKSALPFHRPRGRP